MMHSTPAPSAALQLHVVPAGRRLDFARTPGQYAQVYRRNGYQPWECVARNAHSPFIDRSPLPLGAPTEYVVLFQDTAGTITAATAIVQVCAGHLPSSTSVLNLH